MNTKNPIKINRPKPYLLFAEWADGYSATIELETLRRSCPCAECTGEAIGNKVYSVAQSIKIEPGVFELISLKPVGQYALSAEWKNGHSTGLYTWDKLRFIFEQFAIKEEDIPSFEEKYKKESKKIQLKVM